MKIIQIVENLDKGSVENWLVSVFVESRKIRPEWKWTFYCIVGRPGVLDKTVLENHGEIIFAPVTVSNKTGFIRHLRYILKKGDYDVIHSHHDYLSGFYLLASSGIQFRHRILHIHNTDKNVPVENKLLQRLLLQPLKQLALSLSDTIAANSTRTLKEFMGKTKSAGRRLVIQPLSVDLSRFEIPVNTAAVRESLGIASETKIILFVGRMNGLKNPIFIIDILKELLQLRKDVVAVFIGQGEDEKKIVDRAEALGISDHVKMLGWRDDIPAIMKTSDLFLFPRTEIPVEAFGIVLIEAQSAGLPMILSNAFVPEAIVLKELAHFIPLKQSSNSWAAAVNNVLNKDKPLSSATSLEAMKQSPFELSAATRNLVFLYEQEINNN